MEYKYLENRREISGFGGGYEDSCRKMVIAGMQWLDDNHGANPTFDQYKHIFGMTTNENEDMRKLQTHMNEVIDNEATGAMMQACTNHVLYAWKNGWDKYQKEMEDKPEEAEA